MSLQPTDQDRKDVVDAANALASAVQAQNDDPNSAEKAAAAMRARLNVTATALRIGKSLANTDEEHAQLAVLENDFNNAKADLAIANSKLTTTEQMKASFVSVMTTKYKGVPVYGWAALAATTVLILKHYLSHTHRETAR